MVEANFAESAPAKINLYLRVTGRRDDGYHLLDSLVVFAGAADELRVVPGGDGLTLSIDGPYGAGLAQEADNLVLRAARGLARLAGCAPVARLRLTKNLPVASGIGGGSADAAAALRLLQRVWGVELAPARLHELALSLGADVPVCVASTPARMQGIGEILSAAPAMPACGLVLVNPGVAVPTPAVFAARQGGFSMAPGLPAGFGDAAGLADWLAGVGNDLEAPALRLAPAIAEVFAVLRGFCGVCRLARMSGSGATCFALTDDAAAARELARQLRELRADWFVWGGGLFCDKPALP